jgi:hypothetical protein
MSIFVTAMQGKKDVRLGRLGGSGRLGLSGGGDLLGGCKGESSQRRERKNRGKRNTL